MNINLEQLTRLTELTLHKDETVEHCKFIVKINKMTNVMQHGAFVFIMPIIALYMFRVLFAPIIRSVFIYLFIYLQHAPLQGNTTCSSVHVINYKFNWNVISQY